LSYQCFFNTMDIWFRLYRRKNNASLTKQWYENLRMNQQQRIQIWLHEVSNLSDKNNDQFPWTRFSRTSSLSQKEVLHTFTKLLKCYTRLQRKECQYCFFSSTNFRYIVSKKKTIRCIVTWFDFLQNLYFIAISKSRQHYRETLIIDGWATNRTTAILFDM
jgi:hypothetical protein